MDPITEIAQDELDAGADTAAASLDEVLAELRVDEITACMAEPAGPLKADAIRPGRAPYPTGEDA